MSTYYLELSCLFGLFPSEWINFDITWLLASSFVCFVIIDIDSGSFTLSLPFPCVSGCSALGARGCSGENGALCPSLLYAVLDLLGEQPDESC